PVRPANATGNLVTISVFGRDPLRPAADTTGAVQKLLSVMPLPNDFRSGDGLTTGGYTWNRRVTSDRDQFNTRVDHRLNESNSLNFAWTHQRFSSLNGFTPQPF